MTLFARCIIAAGVVALFAIGMPFYADHERVVLDEHIRSRVPGHFVELADGFVHFDVTGPKTGETVVLIHGFSSPMYVWGRLPSILTKAGYRVLRYDLFGRGFSDRPRTTYDQALFHDQLIGLLSVLNTNRPVHLVGLSMGGAIAVEMAATERMRVASLTLIDPAGFGLGLPLSARLIKTPYLGDYLMKLIGDRVLLGAQSRAVSDQSLVPGLKRNFSVQLRYKGTKAALLSTLRNMPLQDMADTYYRVGIQRTPTMLVWGKRDRVIPFKNAALVKKALGEVRFLAVGGAGHLAHYDEPDLVGNAIVSFLAEHPPVIAEPSQRRRRRSDRPASKRDRRQR